MHRSAFALVAGLALVVATGACGGQAKRDAASLVAAVERYRRADDGSKGPEVRRVAASECSETRICDTKRTCLDAIEPTARAYALKDEVSARITDIEKGRLAPDGPEAQTLSSKLDEAAHLLEQGRARMTECEQKLADLHVTYGV